jgi:sulfotransferase
MIYHFVSGLPRSGSTLLAAILRQNPAFHADIISPMGPMLSAMRASMSPQQETHGMWTGDQQTSVLRGVFDNYYEVDATDPRDVIFDTNRRWCADASVLANLFPKCRIICCVRDPVDVVNSFEHLIRKNPIAGAVICNNQNTTVFQRVPIIMAADGVVGYALQALRDALAGPERERLLVIEYADLASKPADVMAWLHTKLQLDPFKYDFGSIRPIPGAEKFDRGLRMEGLHDLRSTVSHHPPTRILPPDIVASLPKPFWRS